MPSHFQIRRQARRRYRMAAFFAAVAFAAWIWGFFEFVDAIPTSTSADENPTDAIVVLTGGSGRLESGFALLANKRAKKLFVSGVYKGVEVRQLLERSQRNPKELLCCVSLGYSANSTASNAIETAAWMRDEGFSSIRLVTASYHMPRSLKEFRHVLPENTKIIPHAVLPAKFKGDQWYLWPGTASLILNEYTKYLIAAVRHLGGASTVENGQ